MKIEAVGTFVLMWETDEALAQPGEAASLTKLDTVGQHLIPVRLVYLSVFTSSGLSTSGINSPCPGSTSLLNALTA